MQDVMTRLYNLPLMSAALIQGYCVGGGAEIATACDFRLMSKHARFGFTQRHLGLTTGFGCGSRLVSLLGRRKALELLTKGELLGWKDGADIGLVDAILPENFTFVTTGRKWLGKKIPERPEVAQAVKKMAVAVDKEKDLTDALLLESRMFGSLCGRPTQNEPW